MLAEGARNLDPGGGTWLKLGGAAGWFVDVSGSQHVIGLSVLVEVAESLSGDIPFTELPRLSGDRPMRGFVGSFLIGDSALVTWLDYSWPIWSFIDGTAHVALGNVFGPRFDDFDPGDLRLSAGFGLAAVRHRDHLFEFMIGFGTKAIDDGPRPEALRLIIGATREF